MFNMFVAVTDMCSVFTGRVSLVAMERVRTKHETLPARRTVNAQRVPCDASVAAAPLPSLLHLVCVSFLVRVLVGTRLCAMIGAVPLLSSRGCAAAPQTPIYGT